MADKEVKKEEPMVQVTAELQYDSSSIKALGDLEAIRQRPGMYIGSTDHPGHLYTEALDNSGDEAQAGYCNRIIACIDSVLNKYSIRDYGRGIPIGKTPFTDILGTTHEIETLQLLYTKSHSGGKFGGDSYKISRGLHGVGNKCINALSKHTKAVTYRDGKYVELIMSRGTVLELNYGTTTEPNGVYVEFIPDELIFDSTVIPDNHIAQISGISKAFGVPVEVMKDGVPMELPYNTIYDLLPPREDEVASYNKHTFTVECEKSGESIVVAFEYTSETNTLYRGYTNMIPNPGGGSHIRFLEDCYKEAWNKYLDDEFKIQDIFLGFRGLSAVFISNEAMAFAGQTKERLTTNKSYFEQFRKDVVKAIQSYYDENDALRKGLIKRFKEYRAAQNKLLASKEIASLVVVNNTNTAETDTVRRRSVVDKLRECTSKQRKGTKLWINEGDSAAGTVISARDKTVDAVLPLRGKIKNVSGLSILDALKSEEVRNIVNSIGAGVGADCDPDKARYEKVILVTDADPDGLNISALVISVMVNICPAMVQQGLFYVAVPPLYGWTRNKPVKIDDHEYIYEFTNDISQIPEGTHFTRYKGLGEMDAMEFWEAVMSPQANLVQIEYPTDLVEFNKIMTSSATRYDALVNLGLIQEVNTK